MGSIAAHVAKSRQLVLRYVYSRRVGYSRRRRGATVGLGTMFRSRVRAIDSQVQFVKQHCGLQNLVHLAAVSMGNASCGPGAFGGVQGVAAGSGGSRCERIQAVLPARGTVGRLSLKSGH